MMSAKIVDVLRVAGLAQAPVVIRGHPRIRRRALDNLERRRRRDNLITLSLAAIVLIGLLGFGLSRSPLLALDTVAIKGLSAPQQQILRAQLGVSQGVNILDIDMSTLARRAKALPWVQKVTMRRRMPSTLEIRVATVRPVAATIFDDTRYLLDAAGMVVEAVPADDDSALVSADPAALPLVSVSIPPQVGRPASDPAVESAIAVAAAMPPPVRGWVVEYRAASGGEVDASVRVPTESGPVDLTVHLGRPDAVKVKAAALVALTEEVLVQGLRPQALDLRIPGRPVVRT